MNTLKLSFVSILICCMAFSSQADTLTVMHYNLMYYDKEYDDCNSTTNNVDSKDEYLKVILGYVNPDIFTVNEVNSAISSVERIKTNTLNINGVTKYKRADFSGSFLSNMIYYNSEKVGLKSQTAIATSPRETNVYKLYLKTQSLANNDTIFLTCFVTHLKAGSTDSDEAQRTAAANTIMNYIVNNNIPGNILLMGDMNLYSSDEGAFISYTTPVGNNQFKFYDPVNMVGDWNNNYDFRTVHSQSTHTTSDGCFSTGGMDDRFDFILSSSEIINGTNGLYLYSYNTVAQDGNRFNQSLISPENSSVPSDVLSSLYNMSDHLPIQMKLVYSDNPSSTNSTIYTNKISYNNPIANNTLKIRVIDSNTYIKSVNICSIIGQKIYSRNLEGKNQTAEINTSNFNKGIMVVEVLLSNNYRKTFKVIK